MSEMRKDGKGEQSVGTITVPTAGASRRAKGFADEQLLPGIPNDITLEHVSTKLPWKAFFILSCVNRRWRTAIQDYQVYDARVRSHSTETLVALHHSHETSSEDGEVYVLSLYCKRDKEFCQLPPIPGLRSGLPSGCQCVSLHGKIYILGGRIYGSPNPVRGEVYVLDLAEQREWRRCADMQNPSQNFGCRVIDEKIHIFILMGYQSDPFDPFASEMVYDPTQNSWSSISPRYGFPVAGIRKGLAVDGGDSCSLRVMVQPGYFWCSAFMARGRVYSLDDTPLYEHNEETALWKEMQSFLLPKLPPYMYSIWYTCHAVGDELVMAQLVYEAEHGTHKIRLLESKGFSSEREEL